MRSRISSIDIVRGLVMIIMALDHTRDLLHSTSLTQNPTDLSTTTVPLFFVRWITHLCAPTFVFLSGVSVYLSMKRATSLSFMSSFLRKRGWWLILLEITLISFAIWFDIQFRMIMLQVIAAIGVGFIVLSFLLKASPKNIGIVALMIIFLHNLLIFPTDPGNSLLYTLRTLWLSPGIIPVGNNFIIFVSYPWLPWIALMLLGFSAGKIFETPTQQNKKFLSAGIIALLLFVVIRFVNIYGDPVPWQTQKNELFTFLSFINVTKYPPSLLYSLLFLGMAFILLRYADQLPGFVKNILLVYGRVPMFYYLLHFYLIRLATVVMVYVQGFTWKELEFGPFKPGRPEHGSGISLGAVIIAWLALVVLLYPLCKWYGKYKADHPEKKLLKYL